MRNRRIERRVVFHASIVEKHNISLFHLAGILSQQSENKKNWSFRPDQIDCEYIDNVFHEKRWQGE